MRKRGKGERKKGEEEEKKRRRRGGRWKKEGWKRGERGEKKCRYKGGEEMRRQLIKLMRMRGEWEREKGIISGNKEKGNTCGFRLPPEQI